MRGFLATVGACLMLGGAACGPSGPGAAPAAAPRTLMDESFVHPWPDDQGGNAWFAEGGYRLASRQPGEFVAVRAPLVDVPRDVIVSGTFLKVGGPAGGGYGLILDDQGVGAGDGKDQSGQFIVAAVGDRGDVGVWRRNGTRWTDLIPWTASSVVHTDRTANDLSVELLAGELSFVVNGQQVADLTSVAAGATGPRGVGIYTGGDLNEVIVKRFRVQAPGPPADVRPTPVPAPVPAQPPAAQPVPDPQRVADLLGGIADDVGAIARSFAGGLDDPAGPVSSPSTLAEDQARLAAAQAKANRLLAELNKFESGALSG